LKIYLFVNITDYYKQKDSWRALKQNKHEKIYTDREDAVNIINSKAGSTS